MNSRNNKPLVFALVIVLVVFLLFCGGAVTMTMMNKEINKNELMSNVSWMWIPTIGSLLLSLLLGWAIFWKKD